MGLTTLEILYNTVWNNDFYAVLILSLIGGAILTSIAIGKGGGKTIVIIAIVLTLASIGIGAFNAGVQANNAVTSGWQNAINQKATFIQKLHGFFVNYERITYDCHDGTLSNGNDNLGATDCKYASSTPICLHLDKHKNCDDKVYDYIPWFRHEYTYTATLNVYSNAKITFGDHLAPSDYQSESNVGEIDPSRFSYGVPLDWERVKNAILAGQIMPGSLYSSYHNWEAVDDVTLYKTNSQYIPTFQKKGLLPTMPYIQNASGTNIVIDKDGNQNDVGYNYNFVQFVGGLKVPADQAKQWQLTAGNYAAMIGPSLQASIMMVFAPASSFQDTPKEEWIRASKIQLQQQSKFGEYILPKNLLLIMCGVSPSINQVMWCQMETGMFTGNEGVKQDISNLKPFQFTPQDAFGTMQATVKRGKQINSSNDLYNSISAKINFSGGAIDQVLRDSTPNHGFHRVSMSNYLYMRTNIKPEPSQLDGIEADSFWWTLIIALIIWATIDGFSVYIALQEN